MQSNSEIDESADIVQTYAVRFLNGKMRALANANGTTCGAWHPAPELAG
ncbi:hypothetical protein ACCT28_36750 [Rhizobium ruizarguesonis]